MILQRTILLLIGALLVTAAFPGFANAQSPKGAPAGLEMTDGKGDVSTFGALPTGQTATTDDIDILAFRIVGEDIEGMTFELAMVDLTPSPDPGFFGRQYGIDFTLEGTQIEYGINWFLNNGFNGVNGPAPTGVHPLGAQFCVYAPSCFPQRIIGTVDFDQNLFQLYVPKSSLAAQDPAYDADQVPEEMPLVGTGARLAEIRAFASEGFGQQDVVPDSGPGGPYALQSGVPNSRIRASLIQTEEAGEFFEYDPFSAYAVFDFPTVSVTPGEVTLVQVRVSNLNGAKRLVNLTAGLVDPADKDKVSLRILSSLTIPGDNSRIVNLIVNASSRIEHRDSTLVRVQARSIGFPDEIGVLKLRLVAAVPPGPAKKDLFLHVEPYAADGMSFCLGCGSETGWMNTLEQDTRPNSDATGAPMEQEQWSPTQTVFRMTFPLDAPLHSDLVLDPKKPFVANVNIRSQVPTTGTVMATVLTSLGTVASGEASYTGQTVSIDMLPQFARISTGEVLVLQIDLTTTSASAPLAQQQFPLFIGQGSKLAIPAIPDPTPRSITKIPAGPAFLTLAAENQTDQFVNPQRVRSFPIAVINEGIEEDVVRIKVEQLNKDNESEPWNLDVSPGLSYRLKPGESAKFGLLVKSPASAKEGDVCVILVNATSENDPNALAQITMRITISENADLGEDSENFTADEDTVKVVETEEKKSPGAGAAFAVVAAAAVVFVLRRRRTG